MRNEHLSDDFFLCMLKSEEEIWWFVGKCKELLLNKTGKL